MFKPTVFIAAAIDSLEDRGQSIRKELKEVIESCGLNVSAAGIFKNPVIDVEKSSHFLKRTIVALDIQELKKCQITLVVTDLRTFSVGTWIEMWEARQMGQYILLYITNKNKIANIFLESLVDKIIYSNEELEGFLKTYENNNRKTGQFVKGNIEKKGKDEERV